MNDQPDLNKLSGELYREWEQAMTQWWDTVLESPAFLQAMGSNLSFQSKARSSYEEGVDRTVCLDVETGAGVWSHDSPAKLWDNMHGGGTLTTPTVAGDTVLVLGRMGPLHAFDAATGEVQGERPWSIVKILLAVLAAAAVVGGIALLQR